LDSGIVFNSCLFSEVDFQSDGSFLQEFVAKPLLIDSRWVQ